MGSIQWTDCQKLICLCNNAQVFWLQNFWFFEKKSKNCLPKSDIVGSIETTACIDSFYISRYAIFFTEKSMFFRKYQIFKWWKFCGPFFELFSLTILPILYRRLNRNTKLLKTYVSNWIYPVCLRKKVMTFKQVSFFGNFYTLLENFRFKIDPF